MLSLFYTWKTAIHDENITLKLLFGPFRTGKFDIYKPILIAILPEYNLFFQI